MAAAQLSLRISLEGGRVTKTIQFDPNTSVFDACRIIRDKFADAVQGQGKNKSFSFSFMKFLNFSFNFYHSYGVWIILVRRRQQTGSLVGARTKSWLLHAP